MATQKTKPEPATQISPARKFLALSAKLASVRSTPAQDVVLSFAPAVPVAPSIVMLDEASVAQAIDSLGVDPMLLARAFMAMEPNTQGLSAQQLYVASPCFWPTSAEGASGTIAMVRRPDGLYVASGLASIVARAEAGFVDHLRQVIGHQEQGVTLVRPNGKVPSIARKVFDTKGVNGAPLQTLLQGLPEQDIEESLQWVIAEPTAGRGRKAAAAADFDPFADLDSWL